MNNEIYEQLQPFIDAINTGEVKSAISLLGGMRSTGLCPLCKGKIRAILQSLPWQVGSCPHCNKILFYINVPFHACGNIGPVCVGHDCEFYYHTDHLDDHFVEVLEADND